jgi:hypothetical protein
MQLNEIIENYSIKEISDRTRIAVENIEYLAEREWGAMRKVQALGFINIIEREYGADLSDLRREATEYYSSHSSDDTGSRIYSESPVREHGGGGNLFSKILLFVLLSLIAGGAWYLFVARNSDLSKMNAAHLQEGIYDSIVKVANNWLGEGKSGENGGIYPEKNVSQREKNDSAENEKRSGGSENGIEKKREDAAETAEKPLPDIELKYADEKNREGGSKKDDTDGMKPVDDAKAEENRNDSILKISDVLPLVEDEGKNETKKGTKAESEPENGAMADDIDTLQPEVPSLVSDTEKNESIFEKSEEKSLAKREEKSGEKAAPKKSEAGGAKVVVFYPRSKIWIGFRNLKSGKRTAEVLEKGKELTFDTSKADYILATGHGIIEFRDAGGKKLLNLNDGVKHFFMIARGGVREIAHEEFQKLNGSKVW